MLKIENFNKIRNQWYGDWQIGRTDEGNSYYALNAKHKDGKRSITVIITKYSAPEIITINLRLQRFRN